MLPEHDPDEFCKAVSAEGVSMAAHYIEDPIYMRGDFLTKGRTYGDSQFPFNSPYVSREYHYGPELVPGAVEGLRIGRRPWHPRAHERGRHSTTSPRQSTKWHTV